MNERRTECEATHKNPNTRKFVLNSKTLFADSAILKFTPAMGGSPENDRFFAYTPAGALEVSMTRLDVAAQFTPGKAYYLDVTPAE